MSKMFEKIKKYYEEGLWSEEWVRNAEGKWLTEEEVEEILKSENIDFS